MKRRMKIYNKRSCSAVITVILIAIFIGLGLYILLNAKIISNDLFIKYVLRNTDGYINYESKYNVLDLVMNFEAPFKYKITNKFNYIENSNPLIYIYNTHDQEDYLSNYIDGYDLEPNIISVSNLLRDELNKNGLLTIVEDRRVSSDRRKLGKTFVQSYEVSREYVKDVLGKYSNLKLIIDLHRDAVDRKNSYITYNSVNYAKVLFVMGKRYDNYKINLELANKISASLNSKVPNISKGIRLKDVDGHNGIYNQDLDTHMILLELGSNNNSVDEIYNTIMVLVPSIKEVLYEDKA